MISIADWIQTGILVITLATILVKLWKIERETSTQKKLEERQQLSEYIELKNRVENLERKVDDNNTNLSNDIREIKDTLNKVFSKIDEHIQQHLKEEI